MTTRRWVQKKQVEKWSAASCEAGDIQADGTGDSPLSARRSGLTVAHVGLGHAIEGTSDESGFHSPARCAPMVFIVSAVQSGRVRLEREVSDAAGDIECAGLQLHHRCW